MTAAFPGRAKAIVPALTGVRALAACWVMSMHLWNSWGNAKLHLFWLDLVPLFRSGYLGVDLFFCLSGFVLTRQVLLNRQGGAEQFSRGSFVSDSLTFFSHRILRVYPAYLVCMAFLLAISASVANMPNLVDVGLHLLLLHNFMPQYVSTINPVFWSMPFEWEFYILFPLLILPVLKQRTQWLVVAAVAVSLAARLITLIIGPGYEIAMLPWRIDTFVAGMAGAVVSERYPLSAATRKLLGWIGAASLMVGAYLLGALDINWLPVNGVLLERQLWIDVSVATLLVGIGGANTGIARVFSQRAIVWVGEISYSLYLWHVPVIMLVLYAAFPVAPLATLTFAIVVSFAVSAASHYVVERPFLAPGTARTRSRRLGVIAVSAMIIFVGAVLFGAR